MSINYDAIKNSLTQAQRDMLEGKKKVRELKPSVTLPDPPPLTAGTSEPSSGWMNCENGCMGRTNGPTECDMCGGQMIPGPSSGLTPGQLKKK